MVDSNSQIAVEALTLAYGDFLIQANLNFTIDRGDIFIIMGGSGCGKSTLLKSMIGLKSPSQGDVSYNGVPFWASDHQQRESMKRGFGTTFQAGALWILFLNTDGTAKAIQKISPSHGGCPQFRKRSLLGVEPVALGDLDGDGTDEIAVGAPADEANGSGSV